MTSDFYVAVSILYVSFAHFLIGSSTRILLWRLFYYFSRIVFVYNTCRLMSHMKLTKNNMTEFDLNLGQLVCLVPDWVRSHEMVIEGHLLSHTKILVKRVP